MEIEVVAPIYGDVCIRKQRRKRQKKLLIELFLDFAKNTTLHGLRYITEDGLKLIEKLFWFVTFCLSVGISFYYIYSVWWKWQHSPVIVSFSEKHVHVHEVPFPSVTICPMVKFKQSEFNYTEMNKKFNSDTFDLNNNTDMEIENMINLTDAVSLICIIPDPIQSNKRTNSSVVDHLFNISLANEDVFIGCYMQLGSGLQDCTHMFQKVLTREGVCLNFNGLAADEIFKTDVLQKDYNYTQMTEASRNWSISTGYISNDRNAYPFRGTENAGLPNLRLMLNTFEEEKDHLCSGLFKGFKIYLGQPSDHPESTMYDFAALPNQLTSMALKYTMVTTSNSLKNYPIKTRQCYFPEDRTLKYYKIYTFNNCRLECLSQKTYETCKCVAFYMPHNSSTEICAPTMSHCINMVRINLALLPLDGEMKQCDCLPSCNYVEYDSEIHKNDFEYANQLNQFYKTKDISQADERSKVSQVDIYFKEPMFMSIHRSELFGITDFLGNCGGLLGLFLGFSCLSLVEIFYFLTFRVYYTIKMDLKREKAEGQKNLTKKD